MGDHSLISVQLRVQSKKSSIKPTVRVVYFRLYLCSKFLCKTDVVLGPAIQREQFLDYCCVKYYLKKKKTALRILTLLMIKIKAPKWQINTYIGGVHIHLNYLIHKKQCIVTEVTGYRHQKVPTLGNSCRLGSLVIFHVLGFREECQSLQWS